MSKGNLRWALQPPGYHAYWHVGVRDTATGALVAFITGTPCSLRVHKHVLPNIIINFLCVSEDVRDKGLAPKLITEITRRSGHKRYYQAVYTLNDLKSRPVSVAQVCTYTPSEHASGYIPHLTHHTHPVTPSLFLTAVFTVVAPQPQREETGGGGLDRTHCPRDDAAQHPQIRSA